MRRLALAAVLGAGVVLGRDTLSAQRAPTPAPSRADSMLATGRLAAAEAALYAAVEAHPRAPEARGTLGLYLASRARFRLAEVLFLEAVQFGADSATALRALAAMAPYRVHARDGPVVEVPLRPSSDPRAIGEFAVRAGGVSGTEISALFDPTVTGLILGREAATAFGVHRSAEPRVARELWIGGRQMREIAVRVDTLAAPAEVRVGLDVLWPLHPVVDERAGILTLGRAPPFVVSTGRAEHVPFVLTFPGMSLVPRVGVTPIRLESSAARALLRGTRWRIDAAQSTVVIER